MPLIEIRSDIAGSVWKIVKLVGDAVEIDEPIVVLESMKMEIPVTSPDAGIVREVLVREGDTVTDGALIARVEV